MRRKDLSVTTVKSRSITIGSVIVAIAVISSVIFLGSGLLTGNSNGLTAYSADAYSVEAQYLLNGFHNSTSFPVEPVIAGGSYTDAREISQGSPANIFISVALNSYDQTYLGSRYSGWTIAFASDQLVLAYNQSAIAGNTPANAIVSEFAKANLTNNTADYRQAFSNLTSGNVKIGVSDPNSDPAGIRGWTSLEIAGYLYENDRSYYTDRLVANGGNVTNSNAALLVPALDNGQIQFLFIYKSAAESKGLDYITLPDVLNFGNESLASFYATFSYKTVSGNVTASPIYLFISALANNSNPVTADNFVTFVLENSGNLSKFGLVALPQGLLYANVPLPSWLGSLESRGMIKSAGEFT